MSSNVTHQRQNLAEQNRMNYVQIITEDRGSIFLWDERIIIIWYLYWLDAFNTVIPQNSCIYCLRPGPKLSITTYYFLKFSMVHICNRQQRLRASDMIKPCLQRRGTCHWPAIIILQNSASLCFAFWVPMPLKRKCYYQCDSRSF
jgi:hypothetical protein